MTFRLRLRCPQCGRALSKCDALSVATINLKRRCASCKTWWSITIEPLALRDTYRVHKATFTAYEPRVTEVK